MYMITIFVLHHSTMIRILVWPVVN